MTDMTANATDLTKVTVNCTPATIAALDETAERTGDTKTDTINRALQVYAVLDAAQPGQGFSYEVRPGVVRSVRVVADKEVTS